MKKQSFLLVLAAFAVFFTANAFAHCEIPCGIYDDKLRMKLIYEHAGTVERSMKKIVSLSSQNPANYNQIVRWVTNKEEHANEIQHIVTQYFMTQRIKFNTKDYSKKLQAFHKILVYAMKCKQTTEISNVNSIRSAFKEFEKLYFGDK